MTGLLPIIEELANARSHEDRAAWLLSCPFGILRKYDFTIRNRLLNAGFPAGLDYLEVVGLALNSVRDPVTGDFSLKTKELLQHARDVLQVAAFVSAIAAPTPQPDHALTEL